jgi:hypothetical protein
MKKNQPGTNHIKHFERMLLLARGLDALGVSICGHEYDPHFFGMWKVIAGSFDHRYQFLWDDRDQVLTVSEGFFGEFGSQEGDWKQIREIGIDARKGADPFKYVEDFFSN